ncbi:hypothetical protein DL96DRAFT_940489 [Flagelloscypha sp. PMI_526]|nr:hypothetical protein DL96DRAFT_940489 [Flagelloscypha sp. PMI_526]
MRHLSHFWPLVVAASEPSLSFPVTSTDFRAQNPRLWLSDSFDVFLRGATYLYLVAAGINRRCGEATHSLFEHALNMIDLSGSSLYSTTADYRARLLLNIVPYLPNGLREREALPNPRLNSYKLRKFRLPTGRRCAPFWSAAARNIRGLTAPCCLIAFLLVFDRKIGSSES